jgi:hypothetical protein
VVVIGHRSAPSLESQMALVRGCGVQRLRKHHQGYVPLGGIASSAAQTARSRCRHWPIGCSGALATLAQRLRHQWQRCRWLGASLTFSSRTVERRGA